MFHPIIVAGEQSWPRRRKTALAFCERRLRTRQRYRPVMENGSGQGEAGCRNPFKGRRETRRRCAPFFSRVSNNKSNEIGGAPLSKAPPNKAPPLRKASTASVSAATAGASNSGVRTAKSDGVSTSITGDKTRDKCIEILYDALALESGFRASSLSFCFSCHLSTTILTFTSPLPQRPTSYCSVRAR